jgi:hypothetical protein
MVVMISAIQPSLAKFAGAPNRAAAGDDVGTVTRKVAPAPRLAAASQPGVRHHAATAGVNNARPSGPPVLTANLREFLPNDPIARRAQVTNFPYVRVAERLGIETQADRFYRTSADSRAVEIPALGQILDAVA